MKNLLVIGAACTDVLLKVDHLPVTGEDLNLQSQQLSIGGCGYNAALCPYANGIDVTLASPVGKTGIYSSYVRNAITNIGIQGPYDSEGENGCTYCLVENSGERTFLSLHGAEFGFDPAAIPERHYDYVYVSGLQLEETDGQAIMAWLSHADIGTMIYAPGPRLASIPADRTQAMLDMHAMIHCNAHEITLFPGCDGLSVPEAAMHVWQQTHQAVIVTLGEKGTYYIDMNGMENRVPSEKAEVADTIGAGDAHCSALMTGLCIGYSLKESVMTANKVAKEVCETNGAVLSLDHYRRCFGKE
ncbi:MAG: PfkB family carbohydrate kinase [Lactimicrobium sp.]|uniref:PfkB family carbohydrate kinase n=1 Tax=Lactimicrobium sp. TaxID=2563780 RepID=UPI002F359A67